MIACQGLFLLTLFFNYLSEKYMKYSSLITEISQVYKLIVQEIEKNPSEADEGKWIERSFGLVVKTWLNIEEMISNYRFVDREEEIYFYKNLKPEFIGNHSVLDMGKPITKALTFASVL